MLAQNFKTAAALRLSSAEHAGLVAVLRMLEREELKHTDFACPTIPNGFNMHRTYVKGECGTAACMLGWARSIMKNDCAFKTPLYGRQKNMALLETFMFEQCDPTYRQGWDRAAVTTTQAAIALRNYLTHGEPRWDEALAS